MKRRLACLAIGVWIPLMTLGIVPDARASSILAGSDYFDTVSAGFDFGGGIVPLTGRFGPGVTDTVVTRLEDAFLPNVGSSDTIRIQMRMLELIGSTLINGSMYNVEVSLDPRGFFDREFQSYGTMTINHEFADNGTPAPEGTFTSSVEVKFRAQFVPVSGGPPIGPITNSLLLNSPSTFWSHEHGSPPPFLLFGAPGNREANCHAAPGLVCPPFSPDFFPIGDFTETHPGAGFHQVRLAQQDCDPTDIRCRRHPIPEPATFTLLISGLGLMAARRWRNRSRVDLDD